MFRVPNIRQAPELRLDRIDGGLSNKYIETQLQNNQSPFMMNMTADDRGGLIKRFGQAAFIEGLQTPIHAIKEYKGYMVIAHGIMLSTVNIQTLERIDIYTYTNSYKGSFFIMNDILYYISPEQYLQFDGTTCIPVEGYIPTIRISKIPSGGGEMYEDFNYLSAGFKEQFSGNGTDTIYQLSVKGLDATTVEVEVNGTLYTEGTEFSVDRVEGTITFTTAPDDLTPNNVVVTAFRTHEGFINHIIGCKYTILYGGSNDTRVFIAGNEQYPNRYYYSDLYKPNYFPENNFNRLGSEDEAITGFAVQYDTLVIFKERSIYSLSYLSDGGIASFPVKPINSYIGCDMPYSIQMVDNSPVFANTVTGVHILLSSQIRDERNVKPISGNINGVYSRQGLLDEPIESLKEATSINFKGKYYLCVGDKVYLWDYDLRPYNGDEDSLTWFYFTNIEANCFTAIGQRLYWGNKTQGRIVTTSEDYMEFGVDGIPALWRSKLFHFDAPDYLKTISEVWFTTRSDTYTRVHVKFLGENGELLDNQPVTIAKFTWDNFTWDTFTFQVTEFIKTIRKKPKIKKTIYFQIEFENYAPRNNLSILSLIIRYIINRKVK